MSSGKTCLLLIFYILIQIYQTNHLCISKIEKGPRMEPWGTPASVFFQVKVGRLKLPALNRRMYAGLTSTLAF